MIDQGGAADAARVVEGTSKAHNLLTRQEVLALVAAYQAGAGVVTLARTFGINRETVARHLEREGVQKRPTLKMTPGVTARARMLYDSGMTLVEVGGMLGVSGSAIFRAFKREEL